MTLHRWHYGQNSYGRTLTWRKTTALLDINTEDTMGRIPMGERLAQEENPGYHDINTEDSMGRISMGETLTWNKNHCFTWHQHRRHYGQNSYGRDACTRRKTLAIMTSTQKTPWAEFLWAKRSHEIKTTALLDINTEDTMGRIPMGETLAQEEKPRLSWHQHRRLHGQNSYGRSAHMKKIHGSTDINTEDTMGRIPMGETLAQKEKPWLSWHRHRRLHGQNSYGRNAYMEKIPDSYDVNTEDTMGRIPRGETLTWRKPTASLTSARKTPWAEFLWANAHMKKNHGSTDVNTEDTMGRIPMGETLVQNLMGHLIGNF